MTSPPSPAELLDGPGSAWWSADTLDKHGNGICLSWGFGHPEARGPHRGAARDVGSLQILVFSGGAPMVWLHQRFAADRAWWRGTVFRFGDSQIEMLQDARAHVVIARLDCVLPGRGGRLTGTVEVAATPSRGSPAVFNEASLLAGPGKGRGAIEVGGRPFTVIGEGSLFRSVWSDGDEVDRVDVTLLLRDHTVLLAARRRAQATEVAAVSIDTDGRASEPRDLASEPGALWSLLGDDDTAFSIEDLDGRGAFEATELRRIHHRGGAAHWHGWVRAPLELRRPLTARVVPASLGQGVGDSIIDGDGRGHRRARRSAGLQEPERGFFASLFR